MSDGIFVLNGENLVELIEQPYTNEDVFQSLLAKYPNLLAGGQINRTDPRRWLLVSREVAVPAEQDGGGRWSLDHLFLDQDAIPTLVEVKRSSDTRIRREVVGQILDYAANAVVYWPIEKMRAEYELRCEANGVDATSTIEALVDSRMNAEQFWQTVKTNLQAGKIRLVFVADSIPPELQRIVEFLNQQMDPAEVLAVEIKQYIGQELKTLVPRVIGLTADAERRKGSVDRATRTWDESSFLSDLAQRRGDEIRAIAVRLMDWARRVGYELKWGTGNIDGTCTVQFSHNDYRHVLCDLNSNGKAIVRMKRLKLREPFAEIANRQLLIDRLSEIDAINLKGDLLEGGPGFDLQVLRDESAFQRFVSVIEWIADQIRG
ncbi:MAG: hypothetical protein JNM18_12530 [Planctomycetaceae bacterium]|nr:hypothetical protein [Planctomycetaceae bacterium]